MKRLHRKDEGQFVSREVFCDQKTLKTTTVIFRPSSSVRHRVILGSLTEFASVVPQILA